MGIDAFLNKNDQTLVYQCIYYHDPNRWNEASACTKNAINGLLWSDYIKYLGQDGKVSKEIDKLPKDAGGLYLFFIPK